MYYMYYNPLQEGLYIKLKAINIHLQDFYTSGIDDFNILTNYKE